VSSLPAAQSARTRAFVVEFSVVGACTALSVSSAWLSVFHARREGALSICKRNDPSKTETTETLWKTEPNSLW